MHYPIILIQTIRCSCNLLTLLTTYLADILRMHNSLFLFRSTFVWRTRVLHNTILMCSTLVLEIIVFIISFVFLCMHYFFRIVFSIHTYYDLIFDCIYCFGDAVRFIDKKNKMNRHKYGKYNNIIYWQNINSNARQYNAVVRLTSIFV